MQSTGSTRALTGTASAALIGGLTVVLYGTLRQDLARAIGGTCVTLIALTVIALVVIHRWIVDTREERRLLAASQREAQAEKSQYFAAQAALEVERGRLIQGRAAERRADAARLQAERKALADEFEECRASLIAEAMETTVQMMRRKPPAEEPENKVIQFPKDLPHQHPQQQGERERSRERGEVAP